MSKLNNAWITTLEGEKDFNKSVIKKTLEYFVHSATEEVYGLKEDWTSEQTDERDQIITLLESLFPDEVVDE